MDRATALQKLNKFSSLAAVVGIPMLFDDESSVGPAIDNSLRTLGFAESELPTADPGDESTAAYLSLLDYYTLELFVLRAIAFADIQVGGGQGYSKKRSQIFEHLIKLRDEARKRAENLGYSVGGSDFVFGEINTSYIEPLDSSEI